jgi:hypothetical protein
MLAKTEHVTDSLQQSTALFFGAIFGLVVV